MTTRLTTEELLWFNERYATVEVEGDYCVIRLEDGSVYSTTTFKESLAHMTRQYETEDWRLAPDWLADPRRRRYPLGFEFDPTSLIDVGVIGAVLAWFMVRLEKFMERSRKSHDIQTRAIIRLLEKYDPEGSAQLNEELDRTNGMTGD